MTVHDENATPPDDDQQQLVAYLDGEIDGTGALAIEQRLARDPIFRRALSELQQSWDLLDDLPQPTADGSFTKTTVEMVAVQMGDDLQVDQQQWNRNRLRKRLTSAAILGAFTCAAFFVTKYWLDAPNRAIVRDLPVIERIDVYEHIDNLEFLEQLADEGPFNEDPRDEDTP